MSTRQKGLVLNKTRQSPFRFDRWVPVLSPSFFACKTGRYRFAVFGGVNRALFSLKATEFAILPLTRSNKRSACAASQSLDLLGVILSQTGLLLIIQLKNTLPQPTSKKIKKNRAALYFVRREAAQTESVRKSQLFCRQKAGNLCILYTNGT